MVTCILSALRFGLAVLSRVALLLVLQAGAALASTVNLAPGLEVTLPSALVLEAFDAPGQPGGPVVVGEIEGEPGYFIAALRVGSPRERNPILWKKLETEIRNRSEGDLHTGARGSFTTMAGERVWYRAYHYDSRGQRHQQVYFLLRSERASYWVILTVAEGVSIDLAIPITTALIRRARLVDQ